MIEILYTRQEGGTWHSLVTDKTPHKILSMLLSFNRDKGKGYPLSRSYLQKRIKLMQVHSVKFPVNAFTCGATFCSCHPDSRPVIFDSYFGDFRPSNFVGSKPAETQNGR